MKSKFVKQTTYFPFSEHINQTKCTYSCSLPSATFQIIVNVVILHLIYTKFIILRNITGISLMTTFKSYHYVLTAPSILQRPTAYHKIANITATLRHHHLIHLNLI